MVAIDDDDLVAHVKIPIHHGLIYLSDRESDEEHGRWYEGEGDGWDPTREAIHVQDDSLLLAVAPSVVSPVEILIRDGAANDVEAGVDELSERFRGTLIIETGILRVH